MEQALQPSGRLRIGIVGANGFIGGAVESFAASLGFEIAPISGIRLSHAGVDALRESLELHKPDSLLLSVGTALGAESRGLDPAARTHFFSQIHAALPELRQLRNLVWIGSGAEYGATSQPYTEDSYPAPLSRYGLAKLQESNLFLSLRSQGVAVWVVRPSVVYGKGQLPGMLIPSLVSAISSGRSFTINAPADSRDFLHVDDLAEMILRCLISPEGGRGVVNAASGSEHPVIEVAYRICDELSRPRHLIEIASTTERSSEPRHSFSIRKAKQLLAWEPKLSLPMGIERLLHD